MDKYDAANDIYCYAKSTVLKNLLNIQDLETLEAAEREITAVTVARVPYQDPPYNLDSLKKYTNCCSATFTNGPALSGASTFPRAEPGSATANI